MNSQKQGENLFNSDRAVKSSDGDELGRKEFAWRIADVIINRSDADSIVIGIDAPWGDGKTSVLNMIAERLEKHQPDKTKPLLGDNVLVLKFNPWRFSDEEQLLKSFYNTLAQKLEVSLKKNTEKLAAFVRSASKFLKPLDAAEANVGGVAVKYNFSEAVKSLGELKPDADLEEVKNRLGKLFEDTKYKVVVVMDDIDRLNKEEMHAIFRLVKLSADIPKVTYILSFDSDRVAEALKDKYGSKDSGKAFLEKIVQVHLPLPPASPLRLVPITMKGIKSALFLSDVQFTKGEERTFPDIFYRAFVNRITNPRLSNRLVNSLCFALPLVKGEVNTLDFILIESIKVYYPDLYNSIKESIILFTPPNSIQRIFDYEEKDEAINKELGELLNHLSKDIPRRHQKGFKELVQYLFPKTKQFMNAYDRYSENVAQSERIKRVSIEEYFPRYFTYGIEPNDVSDNEIDNFLNQIKDTGIQKIAAKIGIIVENSEEKAIAFTRKLADLSDDLQPEIKQTLALAISLAADSFPDSHPDDKQFGMGALIQAVNLTRSLITRLPPEKINELSLSIVEETPSTMFAFDFVESIKPTDAETTFLPNSVLIRLKGLVLTKIKEDAEESTLEGKFGIYAQDLYLFWYETHLDSLSQYAKNRIKSNHSEITSLLAGILKTSIDPDKPYEFSLMRGGDFYKITTEIISENKIISALIETFGHIDEKKFSNTGGERVAKMFIKEFKNRNNQNLRLPS